MLMCARVCASLPRRRPTHTMTAPQVHDSWVPTTQTAASCLPMHRIFDFRGAFWRKRRKSKWSNENVKRAGTERGSEMTSDGKAA